MKKSKEEKENKKPKVSQKNKPAILPLAAIVVDKEVNDGNDDKMPQAKTEPSVTVISAPNPQQNVSAVPTTSVCADIHQTPEHIAKAYLGEAMFGAAAATPMYPLISNSAPLDDMRSILGILYENVSNRRRIDELERLDRRRLEELERTERRHFEELEKIERARKEELDRTIFMKTIESLSFFSNKGSR